ncbi:geminin coiled-coil domain-containing protein 1 [Thalassophryne amazonica]|uniref:geminin coiled-coil domain-containing protein 1 n=1 Tax=Thalassophryne amazonica TaxID=390379 RepID=UPI00147090CF|nr:geminin coiled-coil domain-containing protein 1 [Thalassophryne amazonica]
MWTQQLSPQLQRNKQLQDTLLQREEELTRLQEENNKLRHFLNSSFVRNLEEQAKKLSADWTRKLKRNLTYSRDGPFNHHQDFQQVSKRVCRNLTAEFCSESKTAAASHPNLDLWVRRTLGLTDQSTINTPSDSSTENSPSSSSPYSFHCFADDAEVTCPGLCAFSPSPCSSLCTLDSSFSSALTSSTPQRYCQSTSPQSEYSLQYQEANQSNYRLPVIYNVCAAEHSDFTARTQDYEDPKGEIRKDLSVTAFQSPLLQKVNNWTTSFSQSPERAQFCSSQAQLLETNPQEHLTYSSPLKQTNSWTVPEDTVQFSQSTGRFSSSKIITSSPIATQSLMSSYCHRQATPSVGPAALNSSAVPQVPQGQRSLAFSMSLNQFSSVTTHSFPQGQAFVRKDNEGRWNFTWVPKQGHGGAGAQ